MDDDTIEDADDHFLVCVGNAQWVTSAGLFFLEEDFKVSGEIWRVHKSDPDPDPSNPHAHCIEGSERFVGCKLHLGTAELYSSNNKPLGRYLHKKQFERLLGLIRPKFPHLVFPLPVA